MHPVLLEVICKLPEQSLTLKGVFPGFRRVEMLCTQLKVKAGGLL